MPKPRTPLVLMVRLLEETPQMEIAKVTTRATISSSWFAAELMIVVGDDRATVGAAVVDFGKS